MSQFFAEAEVLIRPNTAGFAAALVTKVNEEVLAAQKAIKPMVVGAVVTPTTSGLAGTAAANTAAITAEGAAFQKATTVVGEHAAQLGQVEKAAIATTAGMLGLRGAVLTAGTAFITTVVGLQVLRKSIGEASALNEEINKTEVIFKKSSSAILEWSKTTASSLGIARVEALRAAGQFGNILVPMGILPERAAILSESLVRLASDMASFNNISPERALQALQSGLVGLSRPLRPLGVQLTAARVQMEAMRETGKKAASEISQQDKILARYTLILKDSAIQAGDFAATQGRLANQSRILRAQLADLGSEIGSVITPGLTKYVRVVNIAVGALQKLGNVSLIPVQPGGTDFQARAKDLAGWASGWRELGFLLEKISPSSLKVSSSIEDMNKRLEEMQKGLKGLSGPAGVAALSIQLQDLIAAFARGGPAGKQFATVLAGILADLQTGHLKVNTKLDLVAIFDQAQARAEVEKKWGVFRDSVERGLDLQPPINAHVKVNVTLDLRMAAAEAAGPAAALAEAKRQRDQALKSIRALLGLGPNASRGEIQAAIDARKIATDRQNALGRAFATLKAADAVIASAASSAAADAKAAASKQEQAARDAATAQANAIQSFIDGFLAGKETLLRRRLDRAGLTETIADDLRINEGIRRVLQARRKAIADRIRSLHLHGAALKIAKDAIAALSDQIAALNVTIDEEVSKLTEQRAAARQAIIDAQQAHLEKLVTIAQTTPGTSDDLKRLNALKDFLTKQIAALVAVKKKTQEQKARLDDYRVALAQTNESIRNLTKESQKGSTFAQQAFAFLQTQQGFVSNLLGNLIPGGLTGGLVGGQPSVPSNAPRQVAGGFEQPRGVNFTAGEAVRTRPVSSGQANTQISLLRDVRDLLRQILRGTEHPEAKGQRAKGASAMDFHIQGTYGM